jgi:hypothetical protein
MSVIKVSEFDVEELVRGMFELSDDVDVVDFVQEQYDDEMTWDAFNKVVNDLLPLVVMGESPLTKKVYRGFGKDGLFFVKQEAI